MTENDRKILNDFADGIIPDVMAVSKRFAPSIEKVFTDDSMSIMANKHVVTLIEGRKPTSPNAPKGNPTLQQILLEWIKNKGITPRPKENGVIPTLEQLSWAMSKSMHIKGDLLWQRGGRENIYDVIFSDAIINDLINKLTDGYNTTIIDSIGRRFSNK